MKNITLGFLFLLATLTSKAQTIAWSSDSEDSSEWVPFDFDGDTFTWENFAAGSSGEAIGFTGALFSSASFQVKENVRRLPEKSPTLLTLFAVKICIVLDIFSLLTTLV